MADLFVAFDWIAALLIAGALALAVLSQKEVPVVRLLLVLGASLTVVRWFMWGFTTEAPWPVRAVIGALMGALLLGATPAMWEWVGVRSNQHDEVKPVTQTPMPLPTFINPNQKLIEQSYNFANSLRSFRSDFNTENERWRKMEWSAFNPEQSPAEKEKIRNDNNDRDEARRREFLNRFLQSYNETAIMLFEKLNEKLKELAIVPNSKTFNTPLPPGFNTFKVTLDGVSRNKFLDEGFVGRAADYYDNLADALAGEKKPIP